jgi:hypothetical protein
MKILLYQCSHLKIWIPSFTLDRQRPGRWRAIPRGEKQTDWGQWIWNGTHCNHGYREVTPELVICPGLPCTTRVFVDPTAMNQIGARFSRWWWYGYIKIHFEICSNAFLPLLVCPCGNRTCHCKSVIKHTLDVHTVSNCLIVNNQCWTLVSIFTWLQNTTVGYFELSGIYEYKWKLLWIPCLV